MQLSIVRPFADRILELLSPACLEIQIAGSVRRQKSDVHDLEFVLIPHRDEDIFGEPTATYNALDCAINAAVRDRFLEFDPDVKRNGERLKRLKLVETGLVVELYIADQENFGNLFTIRTGHKEFSAWLMAPRASGGCMPSGKRQQGGYLWDTSNKGNGGAHKLIPCRTEIDFFHAIGLSSSVPPPEQRTEELAKRLWRRAA